MTAALPLKEVRRNDVEIRTNVCTIIVLNSPKILHNERLDFGSMGQP